MKIRFLLVVLVLFLVTAACEDSASPETGVVVEGEGNQVNVAVNNDLSEDTTDTVIEAPEPTEAFYTATPEFALPDEVVRYQYAGNYVILDLMPMCLEGVTMFGDPANVKYYGGFPEKNRQPCPLNRSTLAAYEIKVQYIDGRAEGKYMYFQGHSFRADEIDDLIGRVCPYDADQFRNECKKPN